MAEEQSGRVGQDARHFGMALALLTDYYQKPPNFMDARRIAHYELGLEHVPGILVLEAARRAMKTHGWFPKVDELLEYAEAIRNETRQAMPFTSCGECSAQGMVEREIDGVKRMVRCTCWTVHQERLAARGVTDKPLALPARRSQLTLAAGSETSD